MKLSKMFIALIMMTTMMYGPLAMAKEGQRPEQRAAKSSKENTKKVSGTILHHKQVNVFANKQQQDRAVNDKKETGTKTVISMIKTEKGNERLVVDLGPMDQLPKIKDGESKMLAEGKLVRVGNKELFVAHKVKIDDKPITIKREKKS
jgi:hypothetical protein